jgi:2',3'-cyclic-nucleotide 2'-phosphodiesterase (5'-nucleotidase family)
VNEDKQMAAQVPGIDVVVGGHSHTLLSKPLFIASTAPTRPDSVNGTVIVQDFQWAGTLGRLDLTLHRSAQGTWSVKDYRGALLPVTSTTPEDPKVSRVIDAYWKPIASRYGEVIGEAGADFAQKGPDSAEYNLVADAVREQLGLEFAIENMGGVRASLTKGPITYGDMVTLDPFDNTIVTFRATGRQLKSILARYRPAVSGIRYVYEGGKVTEAALDGKPIEDDHVYSGATNSYYAKIILKGIDDKTDTKQQRLEVVLAYIRAHKTIQPAYDGRRVLRGVGDFD